MPRVEMKIEEREFAPQSPGSNVVRKEKLGRRPASSFLILYSNKFGKVYRNEKVRAFTLTFLFIRTRSGT